VSRRALGLAAAAVAVGLVALATGCTTPRTEVVLVVQTDGIRVPEDVARIRILVADREVAADSAVYDEKVALCHDNLNVACYTLPLTAVLHPGPKQPHDSVRVQVDALSRDGTVVTSDAALFTFSPKQSLRLDFVLYSNCIGVIECAKRDQACGPDANCITLTPVKLSGEPDLGSSGGDMAVPGSVGDLAMTPPDLTNVTDLSGCGAITCGPGTTCIASQCNPCGNSGLPCCNGSCNLGFSCNGTTCQSCGGPGGLCCQSPVPPAPQPCIDGQACAAGFCPQPAHDLSVAVVRDMSLPIGTVEMGAMMLTQGAP
jgi:hypothetical protein